jgi:hypothetical protein
VPLRDDRDRKKSNFLSYLKKQEEVCRLKSVLKNQREERSWDKRKTEGVVKEESE